MNVKDFRLGTKAIQLPVEITISDYTWCKKLLKRKKTINHFNQKKCLFTPKQYTFLETLCSMISKVR